MFTQPPRPPLVIKQQRPTVSARNFNIFLRHQQVYNHQIQHPLITNNGPGITITENHGSMIEDSIWARQKAKRLEHAESNAEVDGGKGAIQGFGIRRLASDCYEGSLNSLYKDLQALLL
ncbi:hypothetical protein LINGRAHAP2_LOCUS35740 [Linum grandiflorum]